jgi:carbonic anhydrase/acetyltransferase-like protein (isoleucine patch superfamily)
VLIRHRDREPVVDPSAFIAPTAVLAGNVQVGPRARVMYGAILDSEGSRVDIGESTIVCEYAVLRATAAGDVDHPVVVGDHVFISPHATLLGCTVAPCSYIATGATVLQGATVHAGAVVAVGAVVHAMTVVPSGFFVPPNTIAIGDPLTLYSPADKEALAAAIKSIGFARTAFGIATAWEDRVARYRQATEVRSQEFESHFGDVILETTRTESTA